MAYSQKSYSYVDHDHAVMQYSSLEPDVEVQTVSLLMVEDNPDDLDIISHQLNAIKSYNFNIKSVDNLEDARYELSTNNYDIALVDFWLGHETGARVFLESGGRSSQTALVLLTGLRNNNIQQLALRAGALHCVNKDNMSPAILESTIRSSLYTHKIEQELNVTVKALNHAIEGKSEFFAKLGHDLKTPLTCIMGYADAIETGINNNKVSEKYPEYANRIGESGVYLLNLLDNLIQASLTDKEREQKKYEIVDIKTILNKSLDMVEILLRKKEHHLSIDSFNTPIYVECDQLALSQSFINLLTNAIKYTPPGGNIDIRMALDEQNIKLYISDNGPGMSQANISEALRPYGRIKHIGGEMPEGTGLGLPIVSEILARHNGGFTLESEKGKGTTATLTIPLRQPANKTKTMPPLQ